MTRPPQLGRRLATPNGNFSAPTVEATARFFHDFFTQHPELLADIREMVNSDMGAPRLLTVESLVSMAIASAIHGEMFVRSISSEARALHPSAQHDLGLSRQRDDGSRERVTERMAAYLFERIATAFDHDAPERRIVHVGDMRVDADTGEIITDTTVDDINIERVGNRILAALWEHVGIPNSPEWALDSEVVETHYAMQSYGGAPDVDPAWVADPDQSAAAGGTTMTRRLTTKHKTWKKNRRERRRQQRSRKPERMGPTAEGDFKRRNADFPQVGKDGRLRHTKDVGAASSYRGAGANRTASFPVGRDKHTLVASGHFPDGTPYPPILRTYTCVLGGSSRTEAGITTFRYANDTGMPTNRRHATLDRIYTGPDADQFEQPVRALDWTITKSLTANQKTFHPWNEPGVVYVDGFFYTDALPTGLRDLPARPLNTTSEELAKLEKRYDKRRPYAFIQHGYTTAGSIRLRGPATPSRVIKNEHGQPTAVEGVRLNCVNSQYHHLVPARVPMSACIPNQPCGCSATFTVATDDLPSSYEPTLWGSTAWAKKYFRRNLVEAYNSVDSYHYRVGRHSIRVHADKWDFAHLCLVLAGWFKQVRSWLLREGAHAVDVEEFPGAPFHPTVMRTVIERVAAESSGNRAPPDD